MSREYLIPVGSLHRLLRYEPESGELFWLPRGPIWFSGLQQPQEQSAKIWNRRYAGRVAASQDSLGYKKISLFKRMHKAHRIVFAMNNGRWPIGVIDHINHDPSDNRIVNLRECSQRENTCNTSARKNTTSKYIGVSWCNRKGKWTAGVRVHGRRKNLGYFGSEILAARTRDAAAKIYYGNFATLNFGGSK